MEEIVTINGISIRAPGGVIIADDGRLWVPHEIVITPVETPDE